jgi:hypothetical protein
MSESAKKGKALLSWMSYNHLRMLDRVYLQRYGELPPSVNVSDGGSEGVFQIRG